MSPGSNPAARAADAAERPHRTSPPHQHAPFRDGYVPTMPSPLATSRLASVNAPETSGRQAPSLPYSTERVLLPPITSLMDETRPALPPPAPAPSGPGPPTVYPSTSFASGARSDQGPAPFSDTGRHSRAPPPAPLRLEPVGEEFGRVAPLHRESPSGHEPYRQPPSPRRQGAGSAYPSYRNGPNGYVPSVQQTIPPSSRPPSSGSYPPPIHLPPGQFPLPSMSTPASPRERDHASTRRSPYTHQPPPPYSQAQVGPNHEAYEQRSDWLFIDNLSRMKSIIGSFDMFADHYGVISREQMGGQPLLDRLPKEAEMRTLQEQARKLESCLREISTIVQQTAAQSERVGASGREDKDARDMAMYETHSHTLQPQRAQAQAHAHGQIQQQHHQPQHTHLLQQQPQHQQQQQHHAMPSHQQLQLHQMPPPRQSAQSQMAYTLTEHKPSSKRRGRAAPPGKCHSCHRVDTPEWRRGPDGARTLCNACGLHFAKLQRKDALAEKARRAAGPAGESAAASTQ